MDEIHVKSDISYKGGKIFGSNLDSGDATKTVLLLGCLVYKKWSVTTEKLFDIIKSRILDNVISTDNYFLNVKPFKLFSPFGKLETRAPHPSDIGDFS